MLNKLDVALEFLQKPRFGLLNQTLPGTGWSDEYESFGQRLGRHGQTMNALHQQELENQLKKSKISQYEMQQRALGEFLGNLSSNNIPADRLNMARLMAATGNYDKLPDIISPKEEYGAPYQAIDESGKPSYFQVNKTGGTRRIEGYAPIPKKGTSLTTDPLTGQIIFEQGGWDGGLTQPVATQVQKDLIGLQDSLSKLDQVANDYQGKYLTYYGQARGVKGSFLGKLTGESGDKDFIKGKTKFANQVEQLFNQYRKEITGAAASVQELDRLRKSLLNTDQSPEEFEASYEQFRELVERSIIAKETLLQQGFKTGSKDFGREMDKVLLGENLDEPSQISTNKVLRYNIKTGRLE